MKEAFDQLAVSSHEATEAFNSYLEAHGPAVNSKKGKRSQSLKDQRKAKRKNAVKARRKNRK